MSLINDALKRASQPPPTAAPVPAKMPDPALQPVEHKPSSFLGPLVFCFGFLTLLLATGGWYFLRNSNLLSQENVSNVRARVVPEAHQAEAVPQPEPVATEPFQAPADKPTALVSAQQPAKSLELPPASAAPALAAENQPTTPASTSVPAPPPAPVYKLQGIFYKPTRPMAMINGRNVLPGDKLGEAKVVTIQRDSVTLFVDGQTKVLTLSQNQ
jgi:hypothetical protein